VSQFRPKTPFTPTSTIHH